ncbi:UDP-glycosyltransferase UGT5 [Drosophila mojavensis]|uniref:Uncharacterized protein n=1 Tax=Drosophila mojavensis TaxID=7230 RepID=B4KAJ7_DROMO|nr:UDP-glycosyltransferase UGT5 [Drosophila mojavensis]EDW15710.1 uncharacterized protein Dmoj_GI22626 [Drosophila mojavensis]
MRLLQLRIGGLALMTLLLSGCQAWAARILAVFPYDMHSQCMLLTPYLLALLERGHQLTMIHNFKNCEVVERLHSIRISDHYDTTFEYSSESITVKSRWVEIDFIRKYFIKINLNVLSTPAVQALLSSNATYDLVLIEPSYTDALFGLATHFNASLVGLATCGSDWNVDTLVGYIPSSSLEPLMTFSFKRAVTLLDRINNWILIAEEWLIHKLIFLPSMRAVHEHFFGHLSQGFMEIRQSFSIVLLNQHFSLFPARSNVPSLVEVGGMHVPKEVGRLSTELFEFIEGAQHGVIIMCLGLEVQSRHLSPATQVLIAEAFQALPQRVIWKFEDDSYPAVNSSIHFSKWLPLQALLAHPNVRLLINHGGMLSVLEAAHFGKPVLGLPVFFDQFRNMECLRQRGVGELLDINTMTRQEFVKAIKQILEQPQYKQNAIQLSERIRDQPLHPLDLAVYWTEYVLRHKGAPFMRISSSDIKVLDYYCLDNLFVIVGRICLPVCLLLYVLHKIIKNRQ